MTLSSNPEVGSVHLLGAGPGDPGLITVRALQCLQTADLILYDYLANAALVEHTAEGAELIRLGRHDQGRTMTPEEICEVMVEAALQGKRVVRLKGGDPSIFARVGPPASPSRLCRVSPLDWPQPPTLRSPSRTSKTPQQWHWSPVTSETRKRIGESPIWTIRPWQLFREPWCSTWE